MYRERLTRVKQVCADNQVDSFFISNFYNILYLTGFKTLTTDEREAFVFVTKKNIYLFTDARYIYTNPGVTLKLIEPGKGLFFHLETIIKEEKISSMGIESEDLRIHEYEKLKNLFSFIKITQLERALIRLRAIKEDEEIQKIQKACEITDQCLEDIFPSISVGDTEKKLAFGIEQWIKKQGFDLAFDPIVAVDEHSAIPHYNTKEGNGEVKKSSVILIDFGVKYHDYMSDITRMVFINPTKEIITVYEELLSVQESTIEIVGKETDPKAIDTLCRTSLKKKELPDFPHSLGHGVGLEIHEYPKISKMSDDTILNNQVITVEPGVYFPEKWGMRVEDTVVIKNHKAESLTKFDKKLLILPI
ncbi:aminopeptidase P family protein [Candidatus Roizmanbacteria bacterium]|nr:aminopeptidase P family protein [Candidatus Roizmanbacteria bacterium]